MKKRQTIWGMYLFGLLAVLVGMYTYFRHLVYSFNQALLADSSLMIPWHENIFALMALPFGILLILIFNTWEHRKWRKARKNGR